MNAAGHRQQAACPHFNAIDPVYLANPYPTYAALRRDAPVFHDPQFDLWVVSRYRDVATAVKHPEIFSSSGSLTAAGRFPPSVEAMLTGALSTVTPILTEADGDIHARMRATYNPSFNRKRIARMEPHVRAIAEELIDEFAARGKAELVSQFVSLLPGWVMCDLLGLPRTDFPKLKAWNDNWASLLSVNVPEHEQTRRAPSILAFENYMREQLLDRRENPREDLLTVTLPSELGGTTALSMDEAICNAIDIFTAGYETTAKMITNALVALFEHRSEYDRLQADPTLLEGAVEEVLRFASPIRGIFRTTTRPVEVNGVTIPVNARVFLLYDSANHDEQHFDDPDLLDVGRPFARGHMTFARGIHFCIGRFLARMEIRIALELLQKRLPHLRLAAGAAPQPIRHIWLRGYESLPVEWDPT